MFEVQSWYRMQLGLDRLWLIRRGPNRYNELLRTASMSAHAQFIIHVSWHVACNYNANYKQQSGAGCMLVHIPHPMVWSNRTSQMGRWSARVHLKGAVSRCLLLRLDEFSYIFQTPFWVEDVDTTCIGRKRDSQAHKSAVTNKRNTRPYGTEEQRKEHRSEQGFKV